MKVKLNINELLTLWYQTNYQVQNEIYFKRLTILSDQIVSEMIRLDCDVTVNYCTFGASDNGCSVVLQAGGLSYEVWVPTNSQHYSDLNGKIQNSLYGEE